MRLINADALKKSFISDISLPRIRKVYSDLTVCMEIDNAPTVYNIPENPTNGDVIKALFKPNWITQTDDVVREEYEFDEVWWNTPYQKGGNSEC